MTNNQKLNKLYNIKNDLEDDSSQITTINSSIQKVADDFANMIKSDSCVSIKANIEGYKEVMQSNDGNISDAKSYCQYEINKVLQDLEEENRRIEAERQAKEAERQARESEKLKKK